MITAPQMKAARALLGIDQRQLAELAGLSLPTIQRMEASKGVIRGNVDSLMKLVEALALAGPNATVGLMATFAPTLASMPPEFAVAAPGVRLVPCLAAAALAALDRGDGEGHDREAAAAATAIAGCDVIALAQFSLARAAPMIAAATGKPVLTTPESAVRKMKRLLGA